MASPRKAATGRDNFRRGVVGEWIGVLYLLAKGYWPIHWRYKTKSGEIDWIVRRGRQIVFVEIKSRRDIWNASDANGAAQQRRISAASDIFTSRHPQYASGYYLRYDEILLAPGKWPVHIQSAWS